MLAKLGSRTKSYAGQFCFFPRAVKEHGNAVPQTARCLKLQRKDGSKFEEIQIYGRRFVVVYSECEKTKLE